MAPRKGRAMAASNGHVRIPSGRTGTVRYMEETEYKGTWVEVRLDTNMDTYFGILDLMNDDVPAGFAAWGEQVLVGWNIADTEGEPIPPTAAGMRKLPMPLGLRLILDWRDHVANPASPLELTLPGSPLWDQQAAHSLLPTSGQGS